MGEVIFSGTEARRGTNYAEAALTLEDVDADILDKWGSAAELTVTRKIYRTGEREYLINSRKARLKDVRDIFFDAGIGPKSISIIEQEKVTKIVNATPIELRNYLEETAGLARYKERRKDAELRLKQTGENLVRIGDILSVLSEDIIRLEAQVSLLEDYKRLKAERENLEKTVLCSKYRQTVKEIKSHLSQTETLRESVFRLTGEHTLKLNEELALTGDLAALRESINAARRTVDAAKRELAKLESEARRKELEKESAENTKAAAENDIKALTETLEYKRDSLEQTEARVNSEISASNEREEKLSSIKKEIALLREGLSAITALKKEENAKYLRRTEFVSECRNRLNLKRAEQQSFEGNILRYGREIETFNAENSTVCEAHSKAEEAASKTDAEIKALRKGLESASAERDSARAALRESESALAKILAEINLTAERIAFLKKEVSEKSGGEFIERFKAARYASICADEELKALYSDLLVVKDALLEEAVEYAKTSKDSFRFTAESFLEELSLEQAEKIAEGLYKINNIYRKVGEESLAVLRLTKRIEEEEKRRAALESEKDGGERRVGAGKSALAAASNTVLKGMDDLKKSEQRLSTLKSEIFHLEERQKEILRKTKTVEKERELLLKSAEAAAPEIEKLENALAEAEKELAAHSAELAKLDESLEAENKKAELARVTELEYEKASAAAFAKIKAGQEEISALKKDIEETEKNIARLQKRLEETAFIFSAQWEEELQNLYTEIEKATVRQLADSEILEKLIVKEPEIETALAGLRSDMDGISRELAEVDKKIEYHKVKGEVADTAARELSDQFLEYGEEIEKASERYFTDKEIAEINAEIAEKSKEMDGLGELNMAARVEYDDKLAQYKRQADQLEDVKNAMASLNSVISELDSETALLFEDTFYSVRKNLKEVFSKFFGTGEADIKLTDPQDMLHSGVELTFNPPGKKIYNKNLLSGGEKAIAALVLLFALFLRKPTPFCFLDEVDAPLDDENAKKFIGMIRQAAQTTQFVIITHKHLTMSYADSLYGVTMQEGGVSTLLSVELKD
jgi:chromosome segregation protein